MATIERDARFVLEEKDVLAHYLFEPYGYIPYGWRLIVVQSGRAWEKLMDQITKDSPTFYARNDVAARTTMDHFPDEEGSIGTIFLQSDQVYVGLVAHEAVHLASWMCRTIPDVKRRMTFGVEPEIFPEIVGQITAVAWHNVTSFWSD